MALEQGWYDQAREYFEQALALDASNQEAMKGLARANEILSRKKAISVEPIQKEIGKPPPKAKRKRIISEKKHEGQGRSLTQWFKRQSRPRKIGVIGILAVVPLLFLYLGAGLVDMMSPTSEATPVQQSVVPDDFVSGGLGLSREKWEQMHTRGGIGPTDDTYDDGEYWVIFAESNNIPYITVQITQKKLSLEDARIIGESFIPRDSEFVKTYSPIEDYPEPFPVIVDLYFSESLKSRFESDVWWIGGQPGDFIVIYGWVSYDETVDGITIATGNDP
jgi:hypothetical protein